MVQMLIPSGIDIDINGSAAETTMYGIVVVEVCLKRSP